MKPDDRLIVALDLPSVEDAESLITTLGPAVVSYKIGYQLAPLGGFELARLLKGAGKNVFLDLKYHDIGATVEKGVQSVRQFGANLLTVHSTPTVVRAAVAGRGDDATLKILAVTVLTDQSPADVARGFNLSADEIDLPKIVLDRARMAIDEGADGVVASAMEAAALRDALGPAPLIVTPGVRPAGADIGDQKRVATPADALRAGASHLVVGRPITAASDPAAAAGAILGEMRDE
ncbi:MAG: orotidine-5'-phosphate decarboxylase [Alphaproteobacteria bacterium]|nr:orotidine-5'-phosphate decarboxylase [Alphaproteobacteria bacterium]